ncbi:hypothetical protein AN958_05136, partial [Leucoagaricus sp. SymC.cos]
IIIWSKDIQEHHRNCHKVLQAFHDAGFYCSIKKTSLFYDQLDFLGHYILAKDIKQISPRYIKFLPGPTPSLFFFFFF